MQDLITHMLSLQELQENAKFIYEEPKNSKEISKKMFYELTRLTTFNKLTKQERVLFKELKAIRYQSLYDPKNILYYIWVLGQTNLSFDIEKFSDEQILKVLNELVYERFISDQRRRYYANKGSN